MNARSIFYTRNWLTTIRTSKPVLKSKAVWMNARSIFDLRLTEQLKPVFNCRDIRWGVRSRPADSSLCKTGTVLVSIPNRLMQTYHLDWCWGGIGRSYYSCSRSMAGRKRNSNGISFLLHWEKPLEFRFFKSMNIDFPEFLVELFLEKQIRMNRLWGMQAEVEGRDTQLYKLSTVAESQETLDLWLP